MKNQLVIKKCKSCGAIIKILKDCNNEGCQIKCCGELMEELVPNSVDAAFEKHIPTYEKIGDEILVKVNHVMEKEHYIEWICMVDDNREYMVKLYPEQVAEVKFPYKQNSILYSYCNKHDLWKADVK